MADAPKKKRPERSLRSLACIVLNNVNSLECTVIQKLHQLFRCPGIVEIHKQPVKFLHVLLCDGEHTCPGLKQNLVGQGQILLLVTVSLTE